MSKALLDVWDQARVGGIRLEHIDLMDGVAWARGSSRVSSSTVSMTCRRMPQPALQTVFSRAASLHTRGRRTGSTQSALRRHHLEAIKAFRIHAELSLRLMSCRRTSVIHLRCDDQIVSCHRAHGRDNRALDDVSCAWIRVSSRLLRATLALVRAH